MPFFKKKKPVVEEKSQPTGTIETNKEYKIPEMPEKPLTPEQERMKHILDILGSYQGVIDYEALMWMPEWRLTAQSQQFLIGIFAEMHMNGVLLKELNARMQKLIELAEKQ
jgi:hypothetical protein